MTEGNTLNEKATIWQSIEWTASIFGVLFVFCHPYEFVNDGQGYDT